MLTKHTEGQTPQSMVGISALAYTITVVTVGVQCQPVIPIRPNLSR